MNLIEINSKDIPLQSLKVPPKWYIAHNNFYDISPDDNVYIKDWPEGNKWLFFEEDILQVINEKAGIAIDLGWYYPTDPQGSFYIAVIKDNNWSEVLYDFSSRNKNEVVDKLNELMEAVSLEILK